MGSRMSVTLTVFLLAGTGLLAGGCGDQMTGPGDEPAPEPPLVHPRGLSGTIYFGDGSLQAMDMRTGQVRTIAEVGIGQLHGTPDGQTLIFGRTFGRFGCSPGLFGSCNPTFDADSIRPWRVGVDGSGMAALDKCAPALFIIPAFTADGRMACMGYNPGPAGIYIENQLFYSSQEINQGCGFAWSPAGDFMVVPGGANSLFRITLADTTAALLTRTGSGSLLCSPVFAPSGDRIAFHEAHHGSIWVVAADGSNPRRVTIHQNLATRDQMARWSPDGQWLVFMRLGRGQDVNFDDEWGAWIIRADGTGEAQILRFQTGWRSMIWLP